MTQIEVSPIVRRGPPLALVVLLAVALAWGGWLIYRTSFEIDGKITFCLFDDAMISMAYARNLVEGYGLNWAREGEPVEGFTHPLWTALMVPVNALPLEPRLRSLPVQLFSLALLMLHVVVLRRLTLRHFTAGRARHWLPAAVLTAFYYPLAYWALMGMETGLQALLTTLSVLLSLDIVYCGKDRHLALWAVAAAAYLLRMDMLLMVGAVQLFVLTQGGLRRESRRAWLAGLALFTAVGLGYEAFRWVYFHDVLPNTYYLKLTGVPIAVRLLRGLSFLVEFVRAHLLLFLAVGIGTAPLLRRDRRLALPAGIVLLYGAYSVWVGGDVWEMDLNVRANRFLAFVMPQVFLLFNALLNRALDAWARRRGEEEDGLPGCYAAAAVATVAFLIANGLFLSEKTVENWRNLAGVDRPLHAASHHMILSQLRAFQQAVPPGARVAAYWAGIPAYFSDYRMVDLLGYNDREIARSEPRVPLTPDGFRYFLPGHAKWDYEHVLRGRQPDAFFQIWGLEPRAERKLLRRNGYRRFQGYWVRCGADRIRAPSGPAGPAGGSSGIK